MDAQGHFERSEKSQVVRNLKQWEVSFN